MICLESRRQHEASKPQQSSFDDHSHQSQGHNEKDHLEFIYSTGSFKTLFTFNHSLLT